MTMSFSPLIRELVDAFRCLPGVGPKSAQRMVLYLLEKHRAGGVKLGQVLIQAMQEIQQCVRCRIFCEKELCSLCNNIRRDATRLCIVEYPADVMALEQAGAHQGLYFVLSGRLSPIEGMGPDALGIPLLKTRLEQEDIREVILAISPTVEGEATTFYISHLLRKRGVKVSRIAYGVPFGGELEFVDGGTLYKAMMDRMVYSEEDS
jgi:recombination protein RecR